ncbi:MAG: TlpA family protein disulfide reductase [Acidimicrobiia bacterium]
MAEGDSNSKTGLIIGVVGGVVVLLLVAAVMFGNSEVGAEYGEVTIEGEALPLMPQSTPLDQTATGLTPPSLQGFNFSGDTVTIDYSDGRAKAVAFLAHWCPHCQEEVPRVQAWLDATGGDPDVDMYSVSTSMNSGRDNYPPSEWLEREGWTVPVIRDDQENSALISHGAGGFPFWVFTNSDGTVAARTAGQLTIEQLEAILDNLS